MRSHSTSYCLPRAVAWPVAAAWLLTTALFAAAPQPALAHEHGAKPLDGPTLGDILAGDEEVKRLPNSGLGMPSIMGPFPDTLSMQWLGQIPNRELGASRLIRSGATFLSDIWGWTSAAGEEYAIVGHNSGVAFVRVTDPANPVFLGFIPTENTETQRNFWWDVKTFNNHAYFVSEVNENGVGIFDLSVLDGMTEAPDGGMLEADARYRGNGFVRAHNISINEDTGRAYLTGVSKDPAVDPGFVDDGMVILDLNGDPLAPVEVGQVYGRDTHDAQIVSYIGPDGDHEGREIAFVFNGVDETVGIYDVTDIDGGAAVDVREGGPVVISETSYPGASYTHQGWITEDQRFLVMGDEEDELFGLQDPTNVDLPDTARTRVWNIQNLDSPTVVSFFDSPAASIDHNLFVRSVAGREFVFHANYTAGIRVTELTREGAAGPAQVATLDEVAHMDTEPRLPNNNLNFNFNIWEGPWGVYPFLDSGTIMASDGLNGLVLMRLALPE